MPEQERVLRALEVAAATAAAVLLLSGWPWRSPHPARVQLGWTVGVGLAFFLGGLVLGVRLYWPPREDQDRFLGLLLPAVVVVEGLAACANTPRWLLWSLRGVVAASAARVLLDHTTYLTDLAGPGTREWTPVEAGLVLGALGLALIAVWALMVPLTHRVPGPWVPLALAGVCAGAAFIVMRSGYLTGGQLGLVLAAALAGATLPVLAVPALQQCTGGIGVGVVGLFGLLVIGRFFGQLTTAHAALLFSAPLLCWVPVLLQIPKLPASVRGLLMLGLVGVPVSVAVTQAQEQFKQDAKTLSSPSEPTIEDYRNFRR
jgi:hypothetical protein